MSPGIFLSNLGNSGEGVRVGKHLLAEVPAQESKRFAAAVGAGPSPSPPPSNAATFPLAPLLRGLQAQAARLLGSLSRAGRDEAEERDASRRTLDAPRVAAGFLRWCAALSGVEMTLYEAELGKSGKVGPSPRRVHTRRRLGRERADTPLAGSASTLRLLRAHPAQVPLP